ncbi:hypothetical protein [Tropicimonas sp. IMCC6043]|uniref:hypothetical protein n=1 Tax=Tropicimonas sp. IMCC6043 TaxID=2510645 RepID=UPI001F5DF404|nr:hypothetical protein [Tropicimonas sp. IMCC6043]
MLLTLTLVLVVSVAVLAMLFLEDQPAIAFGGPPVPEDVVETRAFVRGVRAAIQPDQPVPEPFSTTETQLNSVIRLGARFVPGFRGRVAVRDGEIDGTASVPLSFAGRTKWLNLLATAPEFDDRLTLSAVQIGRHAVSPDLALEAGRIGANLIVGDGFGDSVLDAATAMQIRGDVVSFDLELNEMGQNGVMRGLFGTMRGSDLPGAEDVDRYYLSLLAAMDQGELPSEGSYLPYLVFTLEAALEGSRTEGLQNAYTSAILALTRVCGARDFTLIVGGLVGDAPVADKPEQDCSALTLNGRIDSRRHFTTAAALQAASNRGFAVSVGEFKELYDTLKSGGFDFTDLAANNSGIRMSNTLMAAPAEDWPDLIARIEGENDVIVPFGGIPEIMSGDEFEQTYGDVESPDYLAMLDRIEARIDGLALHR